jgi:diguanylate cyclase (GGDEF)-like protein
VTEALDESPPDWALATHAERPDAGAQLVDLLPVAVICLDDTGRAIFVNAVWTRLTGRAEETELGDGWLDRVSLRERAEIGTWARAGVEEPRTATRDVWINTVIGARLLRFTGRPEIGSTGRATRYVLCASDVTEQVAYEDRLLHDARHDALTGLTNRGGFIEAATRLTSDGARTGRTDALLLLDLDRFKSINDAGGHGVGDQVLQTVAARIRDAVRPADVVARFGGDEFAVLAVDVTTAAEAYALATRVLSSLSLPMSFEGHDWQVGVSIGIATTSDGHVGDLVVHADACLYAAKAQGKGRVVATDTNAPPLLPRQGAPADVCARPLSTRARPLTPPPLHGVYFYDDDDDLLAPLAGYVGAGLLSEGGVILIATAEHRRQLSRRLSQDLLRDARTSGRYLELDAAETLRRITRSGYPDPDLFQMIVGTAVLGGLARYGQLRAYGEMVGLLWADGNAAASERLEALWNDLQQRVSFSLLCAYARTRRPQDRLDRIRSLHTTSLRADC